MKKITLEEEALLTKNEFLPKKSKFPALFKEIETLEVGNGKLFVSKKDLAEAFAKRRFFPNIQGAFRKFME